MTQDTDPFDIKTDELKLMAGEMTAGELRTVRAVLGGLKARWERRASTNREPAPGNVYPCVEITVDDFGNVISGSLYAPGLSAGTFNVYPIGIEDCATGRPANVSGKDSGAKALRQDQPEKGAAALREARQRELNETARAAVRQYGRTGLITEDVENDRHASMLDLKSAVEQWDALAGETP